MSDLIGEYKRNFEQGFQRIVGSDSVFEWAASRRAVGDVVVTKILDTIIFGPKRYFNESLDELRLQRALDVDRSDPFHAWLYDAYQRQEREVFLLVKMWWCYLKLQNLLAQGAAILRLREIWELENLSKLL
jgi:hypothetical protein